MNPVWQEFLGAAGARFDANALPDFGDLPAELLAGRDGTIVSPLLHLGLLEFVGEDTKSFLHNQLTSDINHLPPDLAQHSAWCSAKGRMLASFLLYRHEIGTQEAEKIQALISAELLETSLKRLQMFVLRSRVKLSDVSGTRVLLGVAGPLAEQALQAAEIPVPEKELGTLAFSAGIVIRFATTRFIVITETERATTIWQKLSTIARPASPLVWQWMDIQAGIPLISTATREAFVPQMANFDKIGGVSFHKGCYPGQEVVARTQYLGKVKRHLYRIHTTEGFAAGTSLFAPSAPPEQPCGLVVNAAPAPGGGYDALAVIQESFVDGNALNDGLRLELAAGKAIAVERIEAA